MKKIQFILLFALFANLKCEKPPEFDSKVTVINKSNIDLHLNMGFIVDKKDTLLRGSHKPSSGVGDTFTIFQNSEKDFLGEAKAYSSTHPNSFFAVWLFDKNEFDSNSWDYLRDNYRVLKTCIFSKDSCDKLDYNIVVKYP